MANEYLEMVASQLGMSIWLLILILVWSLSWKLIALWKSARKGSLAWFIAIAIFNTIGVLPILYIFVFSRLHHKPVAKRKKKSKKKVRKK